MNNSDPPKRLMHNCLQVLVLHTAYCCCNYQNIWGIRLWGGQLPPPTPCPDVKPRRQRLWEYSQNTGSLAVACKGANNYHCTLIRVVFRRSYNRDTEMLKARSTASLRCTIVDIILHTPYLNLKFGNCHALQLEAGCSKASGVESCTFRLL